MPLDQKDVAELLSTQGMTEEKAKALANFMEKAATQNGVHSPPESKRDHISSLFNILIGVFALALLGLFGYLFTMHGKLTDIEYRTRALEKQVQDLTPPKK